MSLNKNCPNVAARKSVKLFLQNALPCINDGVLNSPLSPISSLNAGRNGAEKILYLNSFYSVKLLVNA